MALIASLGVGCRGLLVHAESEQVRWFYKRLLLLKDIRRTLGR